MLISEILKCMWIKFSFSLLELQALEMYFKDTNTDTHV